MVARIALLLGCLAGLYTCGQATVGCRLNSLYPYGKRRGDMVKEGGDDTAWLFTLPTGLDFTYFNSIKTSFQISVNGYISTQDRNVAVRPNLLKIQRSSSGIISGFWNDHTLDRTGDNSKLYFRQVRLRRERDVRLLIKRDTAAAGHKLDPHQAVIITWYRVNRYVDEVLDKPNNWFKEETVTHQLIIASQSSTSGGLTAVIFNYGRIDWNKQCESGTEGCGLTGIGFRKGKANEPFRGFPGLSETAEMINIGDYSNIGHPGRIVVMVNQEDFALPVLTKYTSRVCSVDGTSAVVKTFDEATHLRMDAPARRYIFSKMSQDDGASRDTCKFMSRAITNASQGGGLDWVAYSIGIHPRTVRRYKRNYYTKDGCLWRRGHGITPRKITVFPHFEYFNYLVRGTRYRQVVGVDKIYDGLSEAGWVIWSPFCQYAFYAPSDVHSGRTQIALGPHYEGKVLGMCQNDNGDATDDGKTCANPPVPGSPDDVGLSCSCRLDDSGCDARQATWF